MDTGSERDPDKILTAPNVLMVFPKFNSHSFWNLQEVCDIAGVRCPAPPLGLITVAALLPPAWNIRLVNRNAEELSDADLDWADMVMTGGMFPQQADTFVLIKLCHSRGKPVVVGGPAPTSSPQIYGEADFLVLGEAEGVIDQFIEAWSSGSKKGVFEAEKFQVDVSKSPIPRFDLLKREQYIYIGVQFSRGCPFNCEFCDIIELYGRVPRAKTNEQMLAELDTLYRMGHRGHVDFVDDNLIGNKKALKRFLPELHRWQLERNYPFKFSTEASMNLTDDTQLLKMMRDANFFALFVGIESPNTETLIATQKKQNTRRSLADSVHKIYRAGMFVTAGFIVGFDTEKDSVANDMIECIEATGIPVCMVVLMTALPNTQLTRRLEKEGRLTPALLDTTGDPLNGGLNFVTLRPRRDILRDYKAVLQSIYQPDAFFERVKFVGRTLDCPKHLIMSTFKGFLQDWTIFFRVMWRMTVKRPELRRHFWRTLFDCVRHNPGAFKSVITLMTFYLHLTGFMNSRAKAWAVISG
ncbi:MAG: radical SAM protein [Xanthobacteraceae bacterium]